MMRKESRSDENKHNVASSRTVSTMDPLLSMDARHKAIKDKRGIMYMFANGFYSICVIYFFLEYMHVD